MSLAHSFRSAVFVALSAVSALSAVPACSSSSDGPSNSLTSGVVRVGSVTEAALTQVVSATADDWGWAGGVFDSPAAAPNTTSTASIPASAPFTFAWHADSTDPAEGGAGGVGGAAGASGFTGMAYLLTFSTPSNDQLLRVFTDDTSFTPSASAWKSLVAAGNPVTLSIVTSTFESDALTIEGGPHQGQTLLLTIKGS